MDKFLLAGDTFMPEISLKEPGFIIVLVVHSQKTKKQLKNLCRWERQILSMKTILIKPVFNMIWLIVNQKLAKRTQSDKFLRDEPFEIVNDSKYDGYQRGIASMVYKFFDKKTGGSGVATVPNYQLANDLQRQIIRKFKKGKDYSSFKDNIFGVDLADMQPLRQSNRRITYLLCTAF